MHEHYVREGWDDFDVGICPVCAVPVRWNKASEAWLEDRSLRVFVLSGDEAHAVRRSVSGLTFEAVAAQLDAQDIGQDIAEQDAVRAGG